jgi:PEP-CTERM motif
MKKFLAALAVFAVFAVPAQAGILSSVLTFDGIADNLLDESRTGFVNNGAVGFDVGDQFFGFASISDVQPQGGLGAKQIAIFYSFEVKTDLGGGLFSLGAVTAGPNTLASLLPDFAPVTNGLGDAAFVVLGNNGGYDPLAPAATRATQANFGTKFTAANWSYEGTGGFATGSDDFMQFQVIGVGATVGAQVGGFTLFDADFLGGSVSLLGVAATSFDAVPVTTLHDVTLDNATIFSGGTSGWDFRDTANFNLNPVPEPSSMLTFAVLGLSGFAGMGRRRK